MWIVTVWISPGVSINVDFHFGSLWITLIGWVTRDLLALSELPCCFDRFIFVCLPYYIILFVR